MSKLGILAGGGDLPRVLIQSCRDNARDVFVIAFDGQADDDLVAEDDIPHLRARLGAAGTIIKKLHEENVEELVFAGSIRRPSLSELRPDWRATRILASKAGALLGDDSLLKAVSEELEKEGFRIIGAHEVAQDILAPPGVLGYHSPNKQQQEDIDRGVAISQELGRLDIGQAAVIQQGLVLGLEAIEGTDGLIERCKNLVRKGDKAVLVKTCKPQQDRRMDMPTIGPRTVENAAESGLGGIAVQANQTILLGREDTIGKANELGLFLVGVDVPQNGPSE